MPSPPIAVIVDNLHLRRWQAEALAQISDLGELLVLNCTNSRSRRRPAAHGLYYALNMISLSSKPAQVVRLPDNLPVREVISFEAEADGAWQRLPQRLLDQLQRHQPSMTIKFGMGLLRIPEGLPCPVLSYHHGDPRRFRGRPAGFYELLQGESKVGQIVQILCNRLDSGEVVAFAETRVDAHSYRATMERAFGNSPLLLRKAVRNALAGTTLGIVGHGKNYRLPSNPTVLRFAGKLLAAKVKRLCYGLFMEKRWQVASTKADELAPASLLTDFPPASAWEVVKRPSDYQFIADPFPHPNGGWLVEALRRSDGMGEVVYLINGGAEVVCSGPGHFSYPSAALIDGRWYMVPETASWSGPRLYELTRDGAASVAPLEVEGSPRIVDPTLHQGEDGAVYLFGSDPGGGSVLRLWTAASLQSRFVEHPHSPLLISPDGARMGGALLRHQGRLFRVGQTFTHGYGDGIILFELLHLSLDSYREVEVGRLRFGDVKGPHTLNLAPGSIVFDFYHDAFSPLAGVRRLLAMFHKRRVRLRDRAPPPPQRRRRNHSGGASPEPSSQR